jgi:hypothetical protein
MKIHWFNQLGELNPQLFREIKGRFTRRNLALSIGLSLLVQFFGYLSYSTRIVESIRLDSKYCTAKPTYLQYQEQYTQINNQLYSSPTNDLSINREALEAKLSELSQLMNANCPPDAINSSLWWRDYWTETFMVLSVFGFFALILIGSYMLINDLATEQRRGTLNFIRLSPQTYKSIFVGKILGVPSLLYLAIALFIPYHIISGISGGISILEIFSFYTVVVASCALFYSFSLLFGLMTLGQSGFQAWLGSGLIFIFLMLANNKPIYQDGSDLLNLFCPSFLLRHLIDRTDLSDLNFPFNHDSLQVLKWFELPLGTSTALIIFFLLFNYSLWTFGIWQGLKRCFYNPDATLFSKQQSYGITGCLTLMNLGFLFQDFELKNESSIINAVVFNSLLFFVLVATLSPHRQTLQDWARYRRERVNGKTHLLSDLIQGERSPVVVAIGLNVGIVITLFGVTILGIGISDKSFQILTALLLNSSLIWLCASLAQLLLLMRTPKRGFWAVGIVGSVLVLPLMIFAFLGLEPSKEPLTFLFSFLSFTALPYATIPFILTVIVNQSIVTIVLNLKLTQQLKKAGESTSKALLSGRSA